jgi:DNA-binding HxlR family transcriptional regulator
LSESTQPAQRKTDAFCWQSKAALRLIRDGSEDYGTGIAVYVALSVVASDKESPEFQTTHKWLATLSGFSERTVRTRLKELVRIGVVSITTPPMKAPCTYKLLTFGNGCRTLGNGCRTFGNGEGSTVADIRRTEESKKGEKGKSVSVGIPLECLQ